MSGARNMPPLFAPGDAALVEAARAVTSRLAPFYQHGVLGGVDLHVTAHLARRVGVYDPDTLLALCLAVRAPRRGHICVDLARLKPAALLPQQLEAAAGDQAATKVPDGITLPGEGWLESVANATALVRTSAEEDGARVTPFVLDGSRLYTDRYWQYQQALAQRLGGWAGSGGRLELGQEERLQLARGLDMLFRPPRKEDGTWPEEERERLNLQRVAAALALTRRFLVITGGPGMGKTWTVRNILALFWLRHRARVERGEVETRAPAVALAAPTGKAAARMRESLRQGLTQAFGPSLERFLDDAETREELSSFVQDLEARTLHRTLGWRWDNPTRFRHDRDNPLAADLIIVDEASMVDFALMSKLVAAVGDEGPAGEPTRLILLGDRNQLNSVEAGTVLADLCGPTTGGALRSGGETLDRLEQELGLDLARFRGGGGGEQVEESGGVAMHDAVVQFNRNFRFSEESGIGRFASRCLAADFKAADAAEVLVSGGEAAGDVRLLPHPARGALDAGARDVVHRGLSPYLELLRGGFARAPRDRYPTEEVFHRRVLDLFDLFRVLCVHRRGHTGVTGLNREIVALLRERGLAREGRTWWQGRPVLVLRNDYNVRLSSGGKGLYNGDIGIVVRTTTDGGYARRKLVAFPGVDSLPGDDPLNPPPLDPEDHEGKRLVNYVEPARLPEHVTTFAMTIHKSQGSEFDHVMVVLPREWSPLLTRELIYTGVTRARTRMTMVGERLLLEESLKKKVERSSGLRMALWGEDD